MKNRNSHTENKREKVMMNRHRKRKKQRNKQKRKTCYGFVYLMHEVAFKKVPKRQKKRREFHHGHHSMWHGQYERCHCRYGRQHTMANNRWQLVRDPYMQRRLFHIGYLTTLSCISCLIVKS